MSVIKEICPDIHLISYPYRGATNSYLIGKKHFILVDTNWYFKDYLIFLRDALATVGKKIEDIKGVVLTHFHIDHSGCATFFKNYTKIYCHIDDKKYLEDVEAKIEEEIYFYQNNLPLWNFPPDISSSIISSPPEVIKLTGKVKVDSTLKDNDILQIEEKKIKVIHTPGHTAGSISLYLPEEKILFSGDTLLSYFITFPEIYCGEHQVPLLLLLNSLEKIKDLKAKLVFPGHGRKITGGETTILRNLNYYREEISNLGDKLSEKHWTFYDLVKEEIKKNNLSLTTGNIIITIRKIQNYLIILEKENTLQKKIKKNIMWYNYKRSSFK